MRTKKFIYKDMGIRPKNSYEMAFDPDMLALLQMKYASDVVISPEYRQRVCDVFGLIISIAMKYLPPKQRKIFYSVWVRSGGKMKEGVLEYSRKVGESYITNYCNYYKAIKNVKSIMVRIGYDDYVLEYIRGIDESDEDKHELF
jgi:hypothetical protein